MSEVKVENLHKRFAGVGVVNGVSFAVGAREVLGFLGPNGAGKTTTMRMITGFLAPDEGAATIDGCDPMEDPVGARGRLGYLPEGAPLYADMTPRGLLEFVAQCRAMPRETRRARIDDAIARVHLDSVVDQRIETLSKGYKRRVGLAQAILHDPQVLILDEPTDGLDPTQKIEVRELIRQMAKDKVIILSTHILEEVEAVCTRAIIIAKGAIVADDTPSGLLAHAPEHNRIVLHIADVGDVEDAQRALAQVSGVGAVRERKSARELHARLLPTADADVESIIARVGELALQHRWKVRELRRGGGSLERAFTQLTRADARRRAA